MEPSLAFTSSVSARHKRALEAQRGVVRSALDSAPCRGTQRRRTPENRTFGPWSLTQARPGSPRSNAATAPTRVAEIWYPLPDDRRDAIREAVANATFVK
jgi:hypothetical protein